MGWASARLLSRAAEPVDKVKTVATISHVRVVFRWLRGANSGTSLTAPARRSGGWPQLKSQGREIRILGRSVGAVRGRGGRRSLREENRA
ncbi:hypothetical protein GCM10009565_78770 [Amycolatopsis albidoflavus]